MKHILPILTAALLGTATTASAAYYYDYYLDPPYLDPVAKNSITDADGNTRTNESDYFTYGTRDNNGNIVENPNVFSVNRELDWGSSFDYAGANTSYYRIELGANNTKPVTLYLTDFVSEVLPQAAGPFNSSTNALFNMGIEEYGYRTLTYDANSGTYIAGDTVSYAIKDADGNLSDKVTAIDSVAYYGDNREITRYKYELGTFSSGDIIEVYMKDSDGREVYSFSSNENGEYVPFDRNTYETNNAPAGSLGGFGDGGYRVAALQTDAMLSAYYFMEEINGQPNEDYHEYTQFDEVQVKASGKAMPLSRLIPTTFTTEGLIDIGTPVAFGFYGETFGRPLPGGLQFALIAGFFGLGFCYIRRRKAIAG